MAKRNEPRDYSKPLIAVVRTFFFSAFLLLALKDFAWQGFALAVAVPALISVSTNLLPRLFPADKLLLALTNFLCALGVLVLYSTNPAYAYQQALYYGVGVAAMAGQAMHSMRKNATIRISFFIRESSFRWLRLYHTMNCAKWEAFCARIYTCDSSGLQSAALYGILMPTQTDTTGG